MAEIVFIVLCAAGAFALAMRRATLWAWALALAAATLVWQTGLLHGEFDEPEFGALGLLAWVPVVVLAGLSIPALRRMALIWEEGTNPRNPSTPTISPPLLKPMTLL